MSENDPSSWWFGTSRRQTTVPPSQLRVSDAERQEIADVLAHHFAEGRLDRDEFDERVGRAMAAKTRADLAGLLTDLPTTSPPPSQPAPAAASSRLPIGLIIVGVVLFLTLTSPLAMGWNGLMWRPHAGLILLMVAGFLWLRRRRSWRRRSPFTTA